ncbi:spore germination protein GerPE [Bacillus carboniphilus]|uniref:Spore germination protein GerPE n=1 Tax=Bacillus carboniphilus TaxID=86663 RepID=A0ABY9JU22_9BACI|nr:spore germination protein GerPE [Bacillus carboniphilus]WLR42906.1 spore germination protein GerPE [Bacillus carboniphilus]
MNILNRLSKVNVAYINSIGISSIFHVGDTNQMDLKVNVFAIQREAEIFFSKEADLNKFPIYREFIPLPSFDEDFAGAYYNSALVIKVDGVKVTAISSSSVVQVGSANSIKAESRVKNIRQLLRKSDASFPSTSSIRRTESTV